MSTWLIILLSFLVGALVVGVFFIWILRGIGKGADKFIRDLFWNR